MQPAMPAQPAKRVSAFRIGLLFGIILAVILIALGFLGQIGALGFIVSIVSIVISLVAYFFAGYRASMQSGKINTGLLAGMWTGLISELLSGIVSVVLLLPRLHEFTNQINQSIAASGGQSNVRFDDTGSLAIYIAGVVISIILVGAIALGIGAIGGAVGKGRAPLPQQAYQESLYQSPSAGGYPPQQPPHQGYPPQQPGNYPPQQ